VKGKPYWHQSSTRYGTGELLNRYYIISIIK